MKRLTPKKRYQYGGLRRFSAQNSWTYGHTAGTIELHALSISFTHATCFRAQALQINT